MRLPRIAIPEIDQDVTNYYNAVKAAGMEPVVISVQSHNIARTYQQEYLDYSEFNYTSYQGLLLPGGLDICPSRYGQKNTGCMKTFKDMDDLQFSILDDFVKSGRPVLGICRGHQMINVYFGGTLIQDLETKEHHIWTRKGDNMHMCRAEEGSWLAELYGKEFPINSSHHQAADLIGKDLVTAAVCPVDGCVESIRHTSKEIYGVQWHPERMCLAHKRSDTVNGLPIFRYFCSVCGGSPDKFVSDQNAVCQSHIMENRMGL